MNKEVILYYFTGTGNTRLIAESLKLTLEKEGIAVEMKDMANKRNQEIQKVDKTYGFIFPVYALSLPKLVEKFMKDMPSDKRGEYFLVANAHTNTGKSRSVAKKILGRKGYKLIGSTSTYTPSSSIITEETEPADEAQLMRDRAVESARNFALTLTRNQVQIEKEKKLSGREKAVSLLFSSAMPGLLLKKTSVNSNCSSCGLCERICPVGNIEIIESRPHFEKNCSICMRCINFCPNQAIEMMSSPGRRQYREPVFEEEIIKGA